MAQEVFITGATGFLGRRLLAELLRQTDCRFQVLVRSDSAQEVLTKHLSTKLPSPSGRGAGGEGASTSPLAFGRGAGGEGALSRLRFIRGDITLPALGIDDDTLADLARSVDEVWHLAASTAFEESKRKETFRINVEGTQTLCDVVKGFRKLDVLYYMSTAYVCGKKLGCIPEGPFEVTEGYKNPYEESKYRSEEVVRASGLPAAILRPSIIMGDSRTGESDGDGRMMYGYALGILRAALHAFDSPSAYWDYWRDGHSEPQGLKNVNARLLVRPEAVKNVVTVDDVVSVCLAARHSGQPRRSTYNVVNRNSITCAQIVAAIERAMRVTGYSNDPTLTCHSVKDGSIVERVAYRNTRLFWPYALNSEPRWETSNTDRLGVNRVLMTERLFEFMIHHFVQHHANQALKPDSSPNGNSSLA